MDSSSKTSKSPSEMYKVRDPSGILLTLILAIVLAVIAFAVNCLLLEEPGMDTFIYALISDLLLLIVVWRLKTIWNGIEVDAENRRLSFQGGGIAANDFADYFKPDYLLQYFKRFDFDIDEISQIQANDITTQYWNKQAAEYQTKTTYTIQFVGQFGAATVKFISSGKRDQIYNIVRQLNQMGTPYVKAN